MTPERWERLKNVLSLALKRPAELRAPTLDEACGDDPGLRREVEELLACQEQMGGFLETPLLGAADADIPDDEVPPDLQQWTRYHIRERLGRGGMAVVYKGWDPRLNRLVAIKLIPGGDTRTVTRFLREAEAQARVEHDHVLKVYETGVVADYHYIAMQCVNGPTLNDVRDETTLDEKVELMFAVAEGLHAAHRIGLVHRDIKPSNILVERGADGLKPYLMDFGLAVEIGAPGLTQTGVVVGTPRYMAPERIQSGPSAVDRRSDVYSLGATFYEFLSGVMPFASTSGLQVLVSVMTDELKPLRTVAPSTPPELDAIIGKCLESDPQRRYASARALADDLRRYLDGDPVLARPSGPIVRMSKRVRKHPRLALIFGAMAMLILATAGWGGYGYWRAMRQAQLAQGFGQEVQNIEWLFRAAQMSPLHSVHGEKQRVRDRMAQLSARMERLGSLAFGPGHYALGRGYLTLGDSEKAREHLEQAWASGYRSPDTSLALGLAYGELYRLAHAAAQRIASDPDRAARIRELQATHRARAVQYLEAGRSSTIVPALYVEALMASHRGEVAGAVAKAREATQRTPWLFEAALFAGHLLFDDAVQMYNHGQLEPSAARAHEADRQYEEAHRIAPSSVDAYVGRCAVAGLLLHMSMHRLQMDTAPVLQRAEEVCGRALVIDSAHAETFRLRSEAARFGGTLKVMRREDPGDAFERAAALAQRAIDLSGGSNESLLTLAGIYMDRAWWEGRTGKDPRPTADRAAAAFERALAADPRSISALNDIAQVLILRSRYEIAQQLDPSAAQERALAVLIRALRIDPSKAFTWRNLVSAAIGRANYQEQRGRDAVQPLTDVLQIVEQLPGDPFPTRLDAIERVRARLDAARAGRTGQD